MNINEGDAGEEIYVAISNSPSCRAPPSVHMPETTRSCVLKVLASYSGFWQRKIPAGVGTFQKHGEQVLVCDRQTPVSGRAKNKPVLRNRTIETQSFN